MRKRKPLSITFAAPPAVALPATLDDLFFRIVAERTLEEMTALSESLKAYVWLAATAQTPAPSPTSAALGKEETSRNPHQILTEF